MEAESSVIYCRSGAKSLRRGFVTFAERNGAGAAQQNKLKGTEQQIIINTFVVDRYRPRRFPPARR